MIGGVFTYFMAVWEDGGYVLPGGSTLGTLKIPMAQGNKRRPTASRLNRRAGLLGWVLGLFDGKTLNDFRPRECGEESIGDKELRTAQPRADA